MKAMDAAKVDALVFPTWAQLPGRQRRPQHADTERAETRPRCWRPRASAAVSRSSAACCNGRRSLCRVAISTVCPWVCRYWRAPGTNRSSFSMPMRMNRPPTTASRRPPSHRSPCPGQREEGHGQCIKAVYRPGTGHRTPESAPGRCRLARGRLPTIAAGPPWRDWRAIARAAPA